MATTSNILSNLGVGSGLDVQSIVSSLIQVDAAPLTALQNKANGISTEISYYGQLSASYSQLQDALKSLSASTSQTSLLGLNVGTSTAAVANASITGSAPAGVYTLNVTALAKSQQLVSATGVPDKTTAIGGGSLTLNLGTITGGSLSGTPGTYSGASFTAADAGSTIAVKAGASLSDIRDAINDANAGVSASLVYDGTNYRLALSSSATGVASSISISATGDAALTNLLNQNPAGIQNFQQTQAASDFAGSINGIGITGSSNTLDKSLDGLTITAYGVGSANLTVSQNTGSAAAALSTFVTAWNGLNAQVTALTSYDAATKTAGPLLGDPLARAAFNSLTTATFGAVAKTQSGVANQFSTLASLGVSIDSKGVASVDNTKLAAALKASPNALANIFSSTKGNVLEAANSYVAGLIGDGGIAGRTTSLNAQLKTNQKQQDDWNLRLIQIRKNLTAQYTALDTSVAKFQSISSFLSNQIAQLNKSS